MYQINLIIIFFTCKLKILFVWGLLVGVYAPQPVYGAKQNIDVTASTGQVSTRHFLDKRSHYHQAETENNQVV